MARRAQAKYEISAEDKTKAAIASVQQGMGQLRGSVVGLRSAFGGLLAAFSFREIIANTTRQEQALRQVEARLKSTKGAAGLTVDELAKVAGELQNATTFGDEAILEMQSQLLTFTKVTGDVFNQASVAILDLATAMNTDLKGATLQVGKALNDPIKGVSALAEAGIQFSNSQRRAIEELVKTGDVAGAQRIILAELETQFGGAARAARDTFGGALTGLGNAFGDLLEAKGGLNDAKNAVEEFTRLLQDPATVEAANRLVTALIEGFSGVAKVVTGLNLLLFGPQDELLKLDDKIGETLDNIEGLEAELNRTRNPRAIRNLTAALEQQRAQLAQLRAEWWQLLDERGRNSGAGATPPPAPAVSAPAAPSIDTSKALLERQTALVRDALSRQQTALDQAYKDGLRSTSEYFRQRAALQEASLDAEIARLRGQLQQARQEEAKAAAEMESDAGNAEKAVAAVTKAREQQIQIIGQITIAERNRADVAGQAARDQAQAESDLEDQLARVRIRLLELTGQTAEARKLALEREYRDLIVRLGGDTDAVGKTLVRRLIDVEGARAQLDQLQQEVELAFQRMATSEQRIDVQRAAGVLTETQARRELVGLHQRTAEEVRKLIPLMQELAAASGDPFAIERVAQLELRLKELGLSADDVATRINGAFEDGLGNLFTDIVTGAKTATEAFRSFAQSVLNELAKIYSQKVASETLGGLGGSQGGLGGAIATALGFLNHSGGLAGSGAARRIPAFAFAGAPRYHRGGVAGLAPDEIPTILKRGEEVLTEGDPRHRYNGGLQQDGQAAPGMRFVLVDDREKLPDLMRSAEGEQVFVEFLTRNRATARSILGVG